MPRKPTQLRRSTSSMIPISRRQKREGRKVTTEDGRRRTTHISMPCDRRAQQEVSAAVTNTN